MKNDIVLSIDRQKVCFLVLLELSSAFVFQFGVTAKALDWIKSFFLTKNEEYIDNFSEVCDFNYGVPQGSCHGPILFLLHVSQLFDIIDKHLPSSHGSADDTQLTFPFVRTTMLINRARCLHWKIVYLTFVHGCSPTNLICLRTRKQNFL